MLRVLSLIFGVISIHNLITMYQSMHYVLDDTNEKWTWEDLNSSETIMTVSLVLLTVIQVISGSWASVLFCYLMAGITYAFGLYVREVRGKVGETLSIFDLCIWAFTWPIQILKRVFPELYVPRIFDYLHNILMKVGDAYNGLFRIRRHENMNTFGIQTWNAEDCPFMDYFPGAENTVKYVIFIPSGTDGSVQFTEDGKELDIYEKPIKSGILYFHGDFKYLQHDQGGSEL